MRFSPICFSAVAVVFQPEFFFCPLQYLYRQPLVVHAKTAVFNQETQFLAYEP